MLLTIIKASISIAVVESPFATALVIVIVAAVEATREASGLRELVLRRRVEIVVGGWIREVWVDSWGTLIVDGSSIRAVAEEPGGVVSRLLHGVCGGRGGRIRVDMGSADAAL